MLILPVGQPRFQFPGFDFRVRYLAVGCALLAVFTGCASDAAIVSAAPAAWILRTEMKTGCATRPKDAMQTGFEPGSESKKDDTKRGYSFELLREPVPSKETARHKIAEQGSPTMLVRAGCRQKSLPGLAVVSASVLTHHPAWLRSATPPGQRTLWSDCGVKAGSLAAPLSGLSLQ